MNNLLQYALSITNGTTEVNVFSESSLATNVDQEYEKRLHNSIISTKTQLTLMQHTMKVQQVAVGPSIPMQADKQQKVSMHVTGV
jgi:cellobiose-specific phosphotransferase system component IIB